MRYSGILFFTALALFSLSCPGQANNRNPNIGYLYPAGGQQGKVIEIIAGGQFLRKADSVYISGEGVKASVVRYFKPVNINGEYRILLRDRLIELRNKKIFELTGEKLKGPPAKKKKGNKERKNKPDKKDLDKNGKKKTGEYKVKMPEHPLLLDLENKNLRELVNIRDYFFRDWWKRQKNRQLSELLLIRITIAPDAKPGMRELRVKTPKGLTPPIAFQVGSLPENMELEPNDVKAHPVWYDIPRRLKLPKYETLELPIVLNGQISPGDVDRFRFKAKKGSNLVFEAHARSLIPYLADAVPGWFQATMTLYDSKGNELAFVDDFRFNPDPVMFYKVPKDGEYELEIRDSIYRGRDDFVYRVSISEKPYITQIFPLGGREGAKVTASIKGWNLKENKLAFNTLPGTKSIRQTSFDNGEEISNPVSYAVGKNPECTESKSNDSIKNAEPVVLPMLINGKIEEPGDVDAFSFKGREGEEVAVEVLARRLYSPLDSFLKLTDASGKVWAYNDDFVVKETHLHKNLNGLQTHHADSYLIFKLPKDGTYYIHISDTRRHGGTAYAYRLRLSAPQPDFALRTIPSSIKMRAGMTAPITVHVLRKDGFKGDVWVSVKDQNGFKINGGCIPAGRDSIRMTLTAPHSTSDEVFSLKLQGKAVVDGKDIIQELVPADDVMQAFLYRHLLPAQEFLVAVDKSKHKVPPIQIVGKTPVAVPIGGSVRVKIKTARKPWFLKQIKLSLNNPPKGIAISDVKVIRNGLEFSLSADARILKPGFKDNIIIDAYREFTPKGKDGKPNKKKHRYLAGILPAVPIVVKELKE